MIESSRVMSASHSPPPLLSPALFPRSAPSSRPSLVPLPAFADNYVWLLHDGEQAWVVDPGDAKPVLTALQQHGLRLVGILVTHHHADHVGGLAGLRPHLHGPIYGPARERIPGPYTALTEGDSIEVLGLRFQLLDVPGHTAGHIAYVEQDNDTDPLLFCGDTLFSAGCGRLFEGTPAQMAQSLAKFTSLPAATRVCCTHEYTLSNLKFAAVVEPANADVAEYTQQCQALRAAGLPTLPSSIGQELRINPFLRCSESAVVAAARTQRSPGAQHDNQDAVAVLATLREWKNRF